MRRYWVRVDIGGEIIAGPVVADAEWPSTAVGRWVEIPSKAVPAGVWNGSEWV